MWSKRCKSYRKNGISFTTQEVLNTLFSLHRLLIYFQWNTKGPDNFATIEKAASGRNSDWFRVIAGEGYGIVCWTMYNKNNFPCHLLILNHLSLFDGGKKNLRLENSIFCLRRKREPSTFLPIDNSFCRKEMKMR